MLSQLVAGGGGTGMDYERRRIARLVETKCKLLAEAGAAPELADTGSSSDAGFSLRQIMPIASSWMAAAAQQIRIRGWDRLEERMAVRAAAVQGLMGLVSSQTALGIEARRCGPRLLLFFRMSIRTRQLFAAFFGAPCGSLASAASHDVPCAPVPPAMQTCPETLVLDARRVVALQDGLQQLALVGCALLISSQVLRAKGVPMTPELARQIRDRFHALLTDPFIKMPSLKAELSALLARRCEEAGVPWGHRPTADEEQAAAGGSDAPAAAARDDNVVVAVMVDKIFSVGDPVFRKVHGSVAAALYHLLAEAADIPGANQPLPGHEGVDAATQSLRAVGVEILRPEVQSLASNMRRLLGVNLAVHETYYMGMLRAARSADGASSN